MTAIADPSRPLPAVRSSRSSSGPDLELLRAYLQAYWLRPENALWMYLRSMALRRVEIRPPALDISCGDGVFSFLHMGGRFAPEFDVFFAVENLDQVRERHADMFDCAAEGYHPIIESRPALTIEFGCDLKPNLLAKAAALKLYSRLAQADNNHPLPFATHAFATVYCNAAYWVEHIDLFLNELRRITRPGGRIILQVKLDSMRGYTLGRFGNILGDRFLDIIDRGRADCWPTVADRPTWESRFVRAGLRIHEATPFVTRTHAHIWDIGVRPIAPLLVRMTEAISPTLRAGIKQDWVSLWCDLLEPFARSDLDLLSGPTAPAEIQYVLG
jgi:SAM-dependent methyltransferase